MRNIEFFKRSFVVLLSLLASSRAGCPTDDAVTPIDLEKFSGEWYTVSVTPVETGVSKCQRFVVEKISQSEFRMKFTAISWKHNKTVSWDIEGNNLEKGINAKWHFSSSPRKFGPYKHQIIDINYESYVVMIVCNHNFKSPSNPDVAMIWSRQRTMNNATLVDLKEKAARYAKEDMRNVDNTCTGLGQ